ncbi:MAG: VCBS repeat-containing protein [Flavobacteriaceae bacterium]
MLKPSYFICAVWIGLFKLSGQEFELISPDKSGIHFENKLIETPKSNIITYEYFYNGGGVAAGDLNNDSLTDLVFTSNQGETRVYLNLGGLLFKDITSETKLNTANGWKTGITLADVNNDGWLDLYISYSGNYQKKNRKNQLYINQKDLTFSEEAKKYGIDDFGFTSQSSFFDYDKDGDLDLFVLNHNTKLFRNFDAAYAKTQTDEDAGDRLYENRGTRFVDVTLKSGIISNPIGYGLGVIVTDTNNDGWPDLYVSNDYVEEDYLYVNNQNGTFSNVLKSQMPCISNFSMGVDAGDVNNDGWVDIVTLDMLPEDNTRQKLLYAPDNFELYNNMVFNGFHHQSMRNMLQLNNGNGTFSDIGQLAGISSTDWSWAPLLADFNNDGLMDLYVTNGYGRDMINRDVMKFYIDERVKFTEGVTNKDMFEVLKGIPSTPLQNYYFVNRGDMKFENKTHQAGFTGADFSHGAIYSDLDNDGDLEIIVNCMNQKAKIFKNLTIEKGQNPNFLQINLLQKNRNPYGIGSRVTLFTSNGEKMIREVNPSRGFQSSLMEPIHFGIGDHQIDSIQIDWNDLTQQVVKGPIQPNQRLEIEKKEPISFPIKPPKSIFQVACDTLRSHHRELLVNDFKVQPLLPYMISYHGPKIKKVDINQDGLDDLFIPSPEGQAPELLIQTSNGSFVNSSQPDLDASSYYEDTNATFFDADADGDLDLYIVSGGYGALDSGISLEDRFYRNDGGLFVLSSQLPRDNLVGAVAVPWDFDRDGDLDVFVGSRVKQAEFPQSTPSLLLINDGSGNFSQRKLPFFERVTDAKVGDFDGDQVEELLVIGDWDYPRVLAFEDRRFIDKTTQFFTENLYGWWNTIHVNDIDNDGDLDLVLGNWGTNNQFKPSQEEPMTLYYDDFDENGYIDPIWSYFNNNTQYPFVLKDELTDQIVSLRKKYVTYASFANETIGDIFTAEQLEKSPQCHTTFLETVWFENKEGVFIKHKLPNEVNISSIHAIHVYDFDTDGAKDIFLAGNVPFNRVRIGRRESTFGIYLKGDGKGNFSYIPNRETGIKINGSVRSLEMIRTPDNKKLVVGVNNNKPLIITINNE